MAEDSALAHFNPRTTAWLKQALNSPLVVTPTAEIVAELKDYKSPSSYPELYRVVGFGLSRRPEGNWVTGTSVTLPFGAPTCWSVSLDVAQAYAKKTHTHWAIIRLSNLPTVQVICDTRLLPKKTRLDVMQKDMREVILRSGAFTGMVVDIGQGNEGGLRSFGQFKFGTRSPASPGYFTLNRRGDGIELGLKNRKVLIPNKIFFALQTNEFSEEKELRFVDENYEYCIVPLRLNPSRKGDRDDAVLWSKYRHDEDSSWTDILRFDVEDLDLADLSEEEFEPSDEEFFKQGAGLDPSAEYNSKGMLLKFPNFRREIQITNKDVLDIELFKDSPHDSKTELRISGSISVFTDKSGIFFYERYDMSPWLFLGSIPVEKFRQAPYEKETTTPSDEEFFKQGAQEGWNNYDSAFDKEEEEKIVKTPQGVEVQFCRRGKVLETFHIPNIEFLKDTIPNRPIIDYKTGREWKLALEHPLDPDSRIWFEYRKVDRSIDGYYSKTTWKDLRDADFEEESTPQDDEFFKNSARRPKLPEERAHVVKSETGFDVFLFFREKSEGVCHISNFVFAELCDLPNKSKKYVEGVVKRSEEIEFVDGGIKYRAWIREDKLNLHKLFGRHKRVYEVPWADMLAAENEGEEGVPSDEDFFKQGFYEKAPLPKLTRTGEGLEVAFPPNYAAAHHIQAEVPDKVTIPNSVLFYIEGHAEEAKAFQEGENWFQIQHLEFMDGPRYALYIRNFETDWWHELLILNGDVVNRAEFSQEEHEPSDEDFFKSGAASKQAGWLSLYDGRREVFRTPQGIVIQFRNAGRKGKSIHVPNHVIIRLEELYNPDRFQIAPEYVQFEDYKNQTKWSASFNIARDMVRVAITPSGRERGFTLLDWSEIQNAEWKTEKEISDEEFFKQGGFRGSNVQRTAQGFTVERTGVGTIHVPNEALLEIETAIQQVKLEDQDIDVSYKDYETGRPWYCVIGPHMDPDKTTRILLIFQERSPTVATIIFVDSEELLNAPWSSDEDLSDEDFFKTSAEIPEGFEPEEGRADNADTVRADYFKGEPEVQQMLARAKMHILGRIRVLDTGNVFLNVWDKVIKTLDRAIATAWVETVTEQHFGKYLGDEKPVNIAPVPLLEVANGERYNCGEVGDSVLAEGRHQHKPVRALIIKMPLKWDSNHGGFVVSKPKKASGEPPEGFDPEPEVENAADVQEELRASYYSEDPVFKKEIEACWGILCHWLREQKTSLPAVVPYWKQAIKDARIREVSPNLANWPEVSKGEGLKPSTNDEPIFVMEVLGGHREMLSSSWRSWDHARSEGEALKAFIINMPFRVIAHRTQGYTFEFLGKE